MARVREALVLLAVVLGVAGAADAPPPSREEVEKFVASVTIDLSVRESQAQMRGAMTLVLEKSSGRWRVLHEHDSLQFPQGDFPDGAAD